MKFRTISPLVFSFGVFLLLLVICLVFTIPMYDSELHYLSDKVDFVVKSKVGLQHVFGFKLEDFQSNTLVPEVKLTIKGVAMLLIIHIGLPSLIYLRFYASKKRNELEQ